MILDQIVVNYTEFICVEYVKMWCVHVSMCIVYEYAILEMLCSYAGKAKLETMRWLVLMLCVTIVWQRFGIES